MEAIKQYRDLYFYFYLISFSVKIEYISIAVLFTKICKDLFLK